jgi:hypothetical protein
MVCGGIAWYGIVRCCMVCNGMVCCSVWYGMVWYVEVNLSIRPSSSLGIGWKRA